MALPSFVPKLNIQPYPDHLQTLYRALEEPHTDAPMDIHATLVKVADFYEKCIESEGSLALEIRGRAPTFEALLSVDQAQVQQIEAAIGVVQEIVAQHREEAAHYKQLADRGVEHVEFSDAGSLSPPPAGADTLSGEEAQPKA